MTQVKSRPQISRTELTSDRRGSADVVPFRSSYRVSPSPSARPWQARRAARSAPANPAPATAQRARGLYPGPCRQTGPLRAGGVLDRDRHRDRARHMVGGDRDLFRVPRRRPHPADRTPGGDAIRLRRPHRRTARQGRSHHQPSVARPGTVRPETRPGHASADRAGIARHGAGRHSGLQVTGSIRPPSRGAAPTEPPAFGHT